MYKQPVTQGREPPEPLCARDEEALYMDLLQHYHAMRETAIHHWQQKGPELDHLIDSNQDTRRGITLLVRLPAQITDVLEAILADFQQQEPAQYYYPAHDMHLTVLALIECYSDFTLDSIQPAEYQRAVRIITE